MGIIGIATAVAAYRKAGMDEAQVLANTALHLVEPLNRRLTKLEAEIETLREENRVLRLQIHELQVENRLLRDGVKRLAAQVESLGHKPVWRPEDDLK